MNLTELASALAALSPSDRDAVFRMAYAPTAAPAEPHDPMEKCFVRIATREEIRASGGDNMICAIKSIREGTWIGLGDAKAAFDAGRIPGTMTRREAEDAVAAITGAWRRYKVGVTGWTPVSVVATR